MVGIILYIIIIFCCGFALAKRCSHTVFLEYWKFSLSVDFFHIVLEHLIRLFMFLLNFTYLICQRTERGVWKLPITVVFMPNSFCTSSSLCFTWLFLILVMVHEDFCLTTTYSQCLLKTAENWNNCVPYESL